MKYREQRATNSGQPDSDRLGLRGGQHPVVSDYAQAFAQQDEISLFEVWRILARYKWMLLAITVSCTLASTLAALIMTPVYRAETLIAPVTEAENSSRFAAQLDEFSGIAALAGVNVERGSRKNEAIATLRSRVITEQFIKDEKLLPVLFHDLWDVQNQRWDVGDTEDIPTMGEAWEYFDEKVRKTHEDRKTGLVVLSIEWEDSEEAARWANELVRRVNVMLRERAARESESAIRYLQDQLKRTSVVELQEVLNRLVESEMKEIILANINEEFAFKVIDPAMAADEPFRPKLPFMTVLGALAGFIGGIVAVLLVNFVRTVRQHGSARQV